MHPLEIAIGWAWVAFWIYGLGSAASSKQSVRGGRRRQLTGISVILYSGTAEERNLAAAFPAAYPEYKSRTKTLIPFLL
jgi:protein-S-isoprenylcysteine O-methyltransferase Ste14